MKRICYKNFATTFILSLLLTSQCFTSDLTAQSAVNQSSGRNLKIGVVNTKKCIEESKLGKAEQANFEKMKNQMQAVLQDKEKALEEIEAKENDEDWVDSVSEETILELGRKKRAIRKEGVQLQNQYFDTLQKTQVKLIQKLTDLIAKASDEVAKEGVNGEAFDLIITDEACTFFSKSIDVSALIIAKMNAMQDSTTGK